MNYVEWLRARRVLIGLAIALGVLSLLGFVLRIVYIRYGTVGQFIAATSGDPGTTRHEQTLPDGTRRTVIDEAAKKVHIVIEDRGYDGKSIVIDQPKKNAADISHEVFGSMTIDTTDTGTMQRVTVKTDSYRTFTPYLAIAWFFAMIVATILGAPFARENDGHLEYAFTKPVSRIALALSMIAIDAAVIIATVIATVVVLIGIQLLFEPVRLSYANAIAMWATALLVPLGWYALLNAVTASMRRASGVVLGLSWPVLFSINALSAIPWDESPLGRFGWFVSHAIVTANPISYLNIGGGGVRIATTAGPVGSTAGLSGIVIAFTLFIAYSTLAVLQWRRVEA